MMSHGTCKKGYEPVRSLFEHHLNIGLEEHAQVCAYVNGECVVDLYASVVKTVVDDDYDATSVQDIFSSTKAITSLVVAMLEDRGCLNYDQLVESLWPEYGQNGKAGTTIAQVMRHEAGLSRLVLSAKDLTTDRIKAGAVSNTIARARPRFSSGSRDVHDRVNDPENLKRWRDYHATSRGWIINEIVRRADPAGRTIGEFIQEEINDVLGIDETELFVGATSERQLRNIHPVSSVVETMWQTWRSVVLPSFLGGQTVPFKSRWIQMWIAIGVPVGNLMYNIYQIVMQPKLRNMQFLVIVANESLSALENDPTLRWNIFNTAEVRKCQIPSANGHANARSLAALASTIAEGGCFRANEGKGQKGRRVRLLSVAGTQRAQSNGVFNSMGKAGQFTHANYKNKNQFTNAGWNQFEELPRGTGRDGWTGWLGIGGSVLQWYNGDGCNIGFGFAGTKLHLVPTNERGAKLQEIVRHCAMRIKNNNAGCKTCTTSSKL
jgi:CubicO group peptidase (beta-lactamase class C family)